MEEIKRIIIISLIALISLTVIVYTLGEWGVKFLIFFNELYELLISFINLVVNALNPYNEILIYLLSLTILIMIMAYIYNSLWGVTS